MPRYHFGSVDDRRESDEDGIQLPDDEAARIVAVRYAAEILQADPALLWRDGEWRVEVTGEDGRLLFCVVTSAVNAREAARAA